MVEEQSSSFHTRKENFESSDYKNIPDEVKYGCDRSWENTIFHASLLQRMC